MHSVASWPCRRRAFRASLSLSLVCICACTGVLQNLGARWVTNKISAVFAFDEAQENATRAAVERTIAAAPELLGPRLDLLVATVDRAICKGMNEKSILLIEKQVDVLMDRALGWVIDEAAPILATVSDEQISHAARELDDRLRETRDELNAPQDERTRDRQDKFIEAIKNWTGRLSADQERAIRLHVAAMPDEAADRLRADERRLGLIADGLRRHPGAPAIRDLLWDAWMQREDWGPGTRSAEARRADGRKTLLFVYQLLDAEQRDRMSERLHEMHGTVKRLMGMAEG